MRRLLYILWVSQFSQKNCNAHMSFVITDSTIQPLSESVKGKNGSILKWKLKMNSSAHGGEYLPSKTMYPEGDNFSWDSRETFHVSNKTLSQKLNFRFFIFSQVYMA